MNESGPFAQLRRQLKRPHVVLMLMAIGALLVFPKIGPSTMTFWHQLPPCAERISVRAYSGEKLVRSTSYALVGQRVLEHELLMPKGEYQLELELDCPSGARVSRRTTVLHEESETHEHNFTKECGCSIR
jgi:hypothetical protein